LDRIDYVLSPDDGLLGVTDFYTSGKQPSLHEKAIGGTSKECGWLSRWFWQIWFDFDHVSLSPHRRDYLEYKFGTVSFVVIVKHPDSKDMCSDQKLQRTESFLISFYC
jgi:betaine lipid synthase